MTFRTQRLFCFLVVLLSGAGQAGLRAQGVMLAGAGPGLTMAGGGANLLNSNFPRTSKPVYFASDLRTVPQKALMSNFGRNQANMAVFEPVTAYPALFLHEMRGERLQASSVNFAPSADVSRQYIRADNYYIQSGFFCKREWEMERTTHIPFRFRLGSLAQCNALEGK